MQGTWHDGGLVFIRGVPIQKPERRNESGKQFNHAQRPLGKRPNLNESEKKRDQEGRLGRLK